MKNLNSIATDLFNKIRGRFPNVTIGDQNGSVTTVPEESRFYDFNFKTENSKGGKVSISLDEENGITVIVGKDITENQPQSFKSSWFEFLRELRKFSKKRLMQFDVRDVNKSNLQKRDYKHLAAIRSKEEHMSESKMYGTNKTSYQKIGNARIAIKHSSPINTESLTGRTQKIDKIFIESPTGERFKYPYRHLSGARAMARHVSEGGTSYDDFGKYISNLSEELSKLRKFNTYMNRNGVMAETLQEYTDIVKERASEIRKEIQKLQNENFYKSVVENFTPPIVEDVPEDVAENWIDQLTIRQFNEELKDVFPYIYKLVGETKRVKELDPEDILGEKFEVVNKSNGKVLSTFDRKAAAQSHYHVEKGWAYVRPKGSNESVDENNDPCWKGYKQEGMKEKGGKNVPNCVPEEQEISEDRYRSDKRFKLARDNYNNFKIYVTKGLSVQNQYLATAVSASTGKEPEKVRSLGKTPEDAVDQVIQKIDHKFSSSQKVTDYATLDFNVEFTHDFFNNDAEDLGIEDVDQFHAKLIPGPALEILNMYNETEEWFEKLKSTFSKGSNRNKQGKNVMIASKLGPKQLMGSNAIANGRYILGTPDTNKYGNYVYPMNFESVTVSKHDKARFSKPAVTVAAPRNESFQEDNIEENNYPDDMNWNALDSDDDVEAAFDEAKQEILYNIKNYDENVLRDLANPEHYDKEQIDDELSDMASELVTDFVNGRYDNSVVDAISNDLYSYAKKLLYKKFRAVTKQSEQELSLTKPKTPLGEFILSYFDRETGKFPKGETAVLTAIEKDYGDQYIEPSRQFIEKVKEVTMQALEQEAQKTRYPETAMIKKLAGL